MQFTVTGTHEAERVNAQAVTPSYFAVLGITPVLGHTLAPDSTVPPSQVMISYGYWQRRFGGTPSVIGQMLTIDNPDDQSPPPKHHSYTIVGVMPPGLPGVADMWTQIYFEPDEANTRDYRFYNVYGRLKPRVTVAGARREMETIAGRLAAAYPKTNANWSVRLVPLLDQLVGPVRPALLILLAAAACVLLIGAANLANLFLVRCLTRQGEMALRTALGATRGRLVRELLAEAALLGAAAGALSLGVAAVGVRFLRTLAPRTLPRLGEIGVNARLLAFCALTSLATLFVFGVLPALRASRGSVRTLLKEGGRGSGSTQQHRLQDGLVVLQVAVALVLLTGAGLLVESFAQFRRADIGFRSEGVLTAEITFPGESYSADQRDAFFATLLERLAARPGVEAASASNSLPGGQPVTLPFTILGEPAPDPEHSPTAYFAFVGAEYFRTLGITLKRGRVFLPTDDRRATKVAVVDALLTRRFFAGEDPLGRQLVSWNGRDTMLIVGVVGSVKQFGLAAEGVPEFYRPVAQVKSPGGSWHVAVRAASNPEAQSRALEQIVAGLDRRIAVSHLATESELMVQSVSTTRFSSFLASMFAVIALLLGMLGIYSILAYVVGQRRREIAVRIALGATHGRVVGDVVRRAMVLTGVGIMLGSGAAWILTRALASLFLGVSPHDPRVFVGAAAVFAVVTLVAASVPAFRTTRIDPVVALTST
jgi:putative ABC transport system permease protein